MNGQRRTGQKSCFFSPPSLRHRRVLCLFRFNSRRLFFSQINLNRPGVGGRQSRSHNELCQLFWKLAIELQSSITTTLTATCHWTHTLFSRVLFFLSIFFCTVWSDDEGLWCIVFTRSANNGFLASNQILRLPKWPYIYLIFFFFAARYLSCKTAFVYFVKQQFWQVQSQGL